MSSTVRAVILILTLGIGFAAAGPAHAQRTERDSVTIRPLLQSEVESLSVSSQQVNSSGDSAGVASRLISSTTPIPTASTYQVDDGSSENALGLTNGGDIMWLNAFQVAEGAGVITEISTVWGSSRGGGLPTNKPVRLLLYEDPDDDGNPSDAVLLRQVDTQVQNPHTDQFTTESIPETSVEGTFFIAALYQEQDAGTFPAPLDQSSDFQAASWIAAVDTPGGFNVDDLSENGIAPLEGSEFEGNWLLRAEGVRSSQNEPPTARDDSDTTSEGTATTTDVLANDSDPDGNLDPATVQVVNAPSNGSTTVESDGSITYTPESGFTGEDTYAYTVEDDDGAESNAATVTITVEAANQPPTATDDVATTDEDSPFNESAPGVLENDSDPDGDDLTVSAVNGVEGDVGTQITLSSGALLTMDADGSYTYDPNGQFGDLASGESATDAFTYTASDGNGGTDQATVTVTITGVNDTPTVATNTGVSVEEGRSIPITTSELSASDPDDGASALTFTITDEPTQGEVLVNGASASSFTQQDLIDNEVAYTHTGSNATDDSFMFDLTDDEGTGPIGQTFAITVVNVNDPPEARDDDVVTDEDFEASASAPGLLGNDTDPDAEDEITVSAVNGSAINVGTEITLESGALLTLNADGSYMYDPNGQFDSLAPGEAATDNFTYTASDGNGGTDQATVTVTINGVNDLPSITSGEASEAEENQTSTNYTATADDPDGDPVTFSLSGGSDQSAFSIDPEGGVLTFDTAPDFENPRDANQDNDYEVEVQASDGNGGTDTQSVTVTVTGVNDPPVLETNEGLTVVQGDSVSLSADSLRTSDVDNEPTEITYSITQFPSQGQLLMQGTQINRFTQRDLEDGRVRYAHTADNASNDSFTFDVRDPSGTGPTGEVAITVLDRTPPSVPDSVRATSAFGEVTVAWEESPEGDLAGYNLYRSTTSFDDVSAARQVNDGLIEETSFTDQGGTAGTTYFYRVTAVDTTGNESTVSPEVQGLPREPTVSVQVTRTFDDPKSEQSYALVGLPGSVSLRVSDIFADVSSDDWIAYREDGVEGGEPFSRRKCGASASCRFQTGNGFWVLANGAFTVEEAFPNVTTSQESDFGISIQDGWNVVSNPFERDVPWSAVQQASGTNQPLWVWNGTWAQASTFASAKDGVAYYFRDDAIDELRVPFDPGLTSQSIAEKKEHRVPVDVRTLTLSLERGDEIQSTVSLGMRPDAKTSLDRYDVFAPPGYFQDDLLRLMREADGQTNLLAAEYQPGSEEGQSFHLTIQADPRTAPALSVEGGSAFDGEIRLVHQGSGKTYDLKEQSEVAPTLQKREEQFTVLIGSQRFVEEKSEEAVSGKSRLVSTYPNPFRGRVTIEYVLAEATTATLTVYDVLGRRVAVVARGEESSGHHTIRWRPQQHVRGLGSGVYFLRLEAGNVIDTQKLTIIK